MSREVTVTDFIVSTLKYKAFTKHSVFKDPEYHELLYSALEYSL